VPGTLIDMAGAREGGARRFLLELDAYLQAVRPSDVMLIGRDRQLSSTWLLAREVAAWRTPGLHRTVALNNVALGQPRRRVQTCVLLRNPLHFFPLQEIRTISRRARVQLALETTLVRRSALRADELVVPTSEMANRVLGYLPEVHGRLRVRPHPLSAPARFHRCPKGAVFLMPALFAPWKGLEGWMTVLVRALNLLEVRLGEEPEVRVTAGPDQLRQALGGIDDHRILAIGRLEPGALDREYEAARAVLYPTKLESFGYPLAEARLRRVPVIGRDTELTREVAGPMLRPVQADDPTALAGVMLEALDEVSPTTTTGPNPFAPNAYFDDLLGTPMSASEADIERPPSAAG